MIAPLKDMVQFLDKMKNVDLTLKVLDAYISVVF